MLRVLLSDDLPKSRSLAVVLIVALITLASAPYLFTGSEALNTAAKICVFILLAASYDLLLGYTGIVSFAHTMFFGIGAYGVALASVMLGPGWMSLAAGLVAAVGVGLGLALVIGLFALRVRTLFFAMMTLAVASAFATLAGQLSAITGGEDGLSFNLPTILNQRARLFDVPFTHIAVTGRILTFYLVFAVCLVTFLILLRIVNAPFGRALQAIRENTLRAESLGFRTVRYRVAANCIAAVVAVIAGALNAIWLKYTGPDVTLSFSVMVDILLMVVIGGVGTLYGPAIGAIVLVIAQNYLQKIMGMGSDALAGIPMLARLIHPDRWLMWLGILFVLTVYFFPRGIVGRLRGTRS